MAQVSDPIEPMTASSPTEDQGTALRPCKIQFHIKFKDDLSLRSHGTNQRSLQEWWEL